MGARAGREKTKYPGVYSYMTADGDRLYYIRYRRNGKMVEEKAGRAAAGMTPARASTIRAAKIDGKALSNEEARQERRATAEAAGGPKWTLEKLFEEYQARLPAGGGRKADVSHFRHLGGLKEKEPAEIDLREIVELRQALEKRFSAQTVKHILSTLTRTVSWASTAEVQLIPITEAVRLRVKMPKIDAGKKTEALTDTQLQAYLAALDAEKNQDAAALLRLAMFTGMRKGALLALTWQDVDFERGFIVLQGESAKNEQTTQIPMNEAARATLQRIKKTESPFVFPGRNGGKRGDFRRMARRCRDKAGLPPDFRPLHGLRHSFASRIASSGEVDMYRLQQLMTHKDPKMTQRYAHLSDEAMKRAAAVAAAVMTISPKKDPESA